MDLKVRTTMCLASAVMAIGVVSWPVAAHADAGASGRLCADPTHECTVSVMGGHAREVAYSGVDVTGAPGVRLRVAAYYVRTDAHGKLTGLERFAVGDKPVVVGETGIVGTRLGFPTVQDDPAKVPSAWIFVGPDDVTMANLDKAVGAFVPYGTLKPTVLGDGWGLEKPVGQTIGARIVGSMIDGTYSIEYQDDAGHWVNVTKAPKPEKDKLISGQLPVSSVWDSADVAQVWVDNPSQPVDIGYELPRGLKHHRYKMRMITYGGDGLIVVHKWDVVPSDHPKRAPYKGTFREPYHRGAPSSAGADERHSGSHVVQGAVGGGAVALALAMAGAGWRGRRS